MTPGPSQRRVRRLALRLTRGTSNAIFQAATLIRAATALEARVDVLFCEAALEKLRAERINVSEWSAAYDPVRAQLEGRLATAGFADMATFLRDAKEHGDDVHFWADAGEIARRGLALDELIPVVDGERSAETFMAETRDADALLTF